MTAQQLIIPGVPPPPLAAALAYADEQHRLTDDIPTDAAKALQILAAQVRADRIVLQQIAQRLDQMGRTALRLAEDANAAAVLAVVAT